jgi:REP-associated tyrosine transposase
MPRAARSIEGGLVYHVLNWGNARMRLFHNEDDFDGFERVLAEGLERHPVELLTYCLMPHHWHLVVRPKSDDSLGRFMGWVGVTHVRRYQEAHHRRGAGHLYQGRYKSFPVAEDHHFLMLCRYVEGNPGRAKRVDRAQDWRWSGMWKRSHRGQDLPLGNWPVERPHNWTKLVNAGLSPQDLRHVRLCAKRGRPLGPAPWVQETAARLGLEFTLRNQGRPRKAPEGP